MKPATYSRFFSQLICLSHFGLFQRGEGASIKSLLQQYYFTFSKMSMALNSEDP